MLRALAGAGVSEEVADRSLDGGRSYLSRHQRRAGTASGDGVAVSELVSGLRQAQLWDTDPEGAEEGPGSGVRDEQRCLLQYLRLRNPPFDLHRPSTSVQGGGIALGTDRHDDAGTAVKRSVD